MQHSFSLEISDLEPIESGVEQEITLEEAEKIIGGFCIIIPTVPQHPSPPSTPPLI
jgi:hypothetical protein